MKISRRDKQILLIFLGIILAGAAFYFVFLPGKEKARTLMTENQQLSTRLTELKQLSAQQEKFEQEIQSMTDRINGVYDEYQTDFRSEDAFMLGRTVEEKSDNTMITAININNQEVVYEPAVTQAADGDAAQTAAVADAAQDQADMAEAAAGVELSRPILYKKVISLTHSLTAEGLKDMIDYITLNTSKMSIESLSVSYDMSTGLLNGNTMINIYLLQGTNKPYVPWTIPSVVTGTDNVFGTLVLPSNVTADGTEETAEGDTTENNTGDTEAGTAQTAP